MSKFEIDLLLALDSIAQKYYIVQRIGLKVNTGSNLCIFKMCLLLHNYICHIHHCLISRGDVVEDHTWEMSFMFLMLVEEKS